MPEAQNPWLASRTADGESYDANYERREAAGENVHGEGGLRRPLRPEVGVGRGLWHGPRRPGAGETRARRGGRGPRRRDAHDGKAEGAADPVAHSRPCHGQPRAHLRCSGSRGKRDNLLTPGTEGAVLANLGTASSNGGL